MKGKRKKKAASDTMPTCDISCMVIRLTFHLSNVQAARETGALQAAKNKLEKQVEELTWRLQLEKRMRVNMSIISHLKSQIEFACGSLKGFAFGLVN